ncbi:serine/threonine protein kinase [Hespellia stercorisuis]|uniref:Serine/threonine protein kinase n=1 Tax=Hespellia stercorisuis DSM 15480 TaxID=1121950 RepID=A0A1M6R668_9FIRM|nr:protein kinase [Hespellia stercorisuis]SHK27952.1 Serine/threonine protein kinase [Hespellia stercorisuis DSM 15480]
MAGANIPAGEILHQKYKLNKVLGTGGFGITYLAFDESMEQYVVIKEYFPSRFVVRAEDGKHVLHSAEKENLILWKKGKNDFLKEARRMAKLAQIRGIVKVYDYFEENDTAYLVMEYVRGIGLDEYMNRLDSPMDFAQAWNFLRPVVDALENMHEKGLIHRDLNPSNLLVTEDSIKVIDFGASRRYLDNEKTMTILVKRGYTPPEQYMGREKQGPWTDVYAFCATIYEMITGVQPDPSIERMQKDELYLPSSYGVEITPEEEQVLANGLEVDPSRRIRSMRKLREAVEQTEEKSIAADKLSEKKSRKSLISAVAAVLAVILFTAAGVGYYRWNAYFKLDESDAAAGNYSMRSDTYQKYLDFVKENATEKEINTTESERYPERNGSMIYTLPLEAVQEWGRPCNQFHFEITEEKLVEKMKNAGYEMTLADQEKVEIKVEVQQFGAIRTMFNVKNKYQIKENLWLVSSADSFDSRIHKVWVYRTADGMKMEQIWTDVIQILDASATDREKLLSEVRKTQAEDAAMEGDNSYSAVWTENCMLYYLNPEEAEFEGQTGVCGFIVKKYGGLGAGYDWK